MPPPDGPPPETPRAEPPTFAAWTPHLRGLCDGLRTAARGALLDGLAGGAPDALLRPVGAGVGDVTFPLDVRAERALDRWFDARAREGPLSLLSEDTGWRHRGPGEGRTAVDLPGFDHGGPRIAVDPVDGTRVLMADLRSAWSVVAFCPPGAGEPRLSDVTGGLVAELPDSRAGRYRVVQAERGAGCRIEERDLGSGALARARALHADDDARPDHGYFPFFRYAPDLRPPLAELEAAFFERLHAREGADLRSCYDDQYTCSAGQLVLLALGRYRMVADLRPLVARRAGRPTLPSKPYDVAGALVCAREAGCVVEDPDGAELDAPLDAATPVAFVGWHNAATAARLRPHLRAVLDAPPAGLRGGGGV